MDILCTTEKAGQTMASNLMRGLMRKHTFKILIIPMSWSLLCAIIYILISNKSYYFLLTNYTINNYISEMDTTGDLIATSHIRLL